MMISEIVNKNVFDNAFPSSSFQIVSDFSAGG